ncbi:MAG: ABC transporter permease subunit [Spirochaetaceae bacterium]|jgi:L-cystine transport system permease protein|nr:ABC transporter permease subunit [Spirochaetaceae bacterium]
MNFDIAFMFRAMLEAGAEIPRSLLIAFSAVLLGIAAGLPAALARFYRVPVLRSVLGAWTTVTKGLPNILVYFMLFVLLSQKSGFPVELITLIGISIGAFTEMTEVFRGALESVEKCQFDAARSMAFPEHKTFFRVVLPQIVPVCLPMASGVVIHAIKALPVAMMIGMRDILNAALSAAVINYRYLESYIAAALIFWGIFIVVERTFLYIEKRYRGNKIKGGAVCLK